MNEDNAAAEELIKESCEFAAQEMQNGASASATEDKLVEAGMPREAASRIVNAVWSAQDDGQRAAGRKNMLVGALWCIGGIVVTAVTYSAASGGGTYVVAWGAIVFGAVQFIRGLIQYNKA